MPVRTISTRIAITGETEYRQALTRLNREQRVLQSELTKTQSAFKDSQNSMEALTAKGKILADLYDLQQRRVKTLGDALSRTTPGRSRTARAPSKKPRKSWNG